MTALSVESAGAAANNRNPAAAQPASICRRNSPLQLTPPLKVTNVIPLERAAATAFLTNTSTAAA